MENQERVFQDVRRFAKDKDIIYAHGLAMVRKGKGYGTLLMDYATKNLLGLSKGTIAGFIDAAQKDKNSGELQLAPNEASFSVCLKAGFVIVGVVDPPVYDDKLTYYSFIRPVKPIHFRRGRRAQRDVNLAEGNAESVITEVKQLVEKGFVGRDYYKKTHEIEFSGPATLDRPD